MQAKMTTVSIQLIISELHECAFIECKLVRNDFKFIILYTVDV